MAHHGSAQHRLSGLSSPCFIFCKVLKINRKKGAFGGLASDMLSKIARLNGRGAELSQRRGKALRFGPESEIRLLTVSEDCA
ncbi:hypothetical protein SAMN04488052_10917 [Aquisalimonas asiatica]|uniref:Uncharacterized protein n=2 Tax=Aquisalimonas asiatica TaxID=406100 RepID=A0A1H8UZJ6_9GAMM|nr:hypothetical protein SAMN04488052_10917 [Aquisalimonas asiatica]